MNQGYSRGRAPPPWELFLFSPSFLDQLASTQNIIGDQFVVLNLSRLSQTTPILKTKVLNCKFITLRSLIKVTSL